LAFLCDELLPKSVGDVVMISQWLPALYVFNKASEMVGSQLVMLLPDRFDPAVRT
jgi:hypothetical protein